MKTHAAHDWQHGIWGAVVFLIVATLMTVMLNLPASGDETTPGRMTDPLRAEHEALRAHLRHMTSMVGNIAAQTPEEQKETMAHVITCMGTNVQNHNKWDEQFVYPQIEKYGATPGIAVGLTATIAYENRIIGRWVSELKNQASMPEPDIKAFARRADNLLGLVMAHFEEEEDVLLPVLDAKMSADEFKKQVADKIEPSTL